MTSFPTFLVEIGKQYGKENFIYQYSLITVAPLANFFPLIEFFRHNYVIKH